MVEPVREMEAAVRRMAGPQVAGVVWLVAFVFSVVVLPLALARTCGWLSSITTVRKPSYHFDTETGGINGRLGEPSPPFRDYEKLFTGFLIDW